MAAVMFASVAALLILAHHHEAQAQKCVRVLAQLDEIENAVAAVMRLSRSNDRGSLAAAVDECRSETAALRRLMAEMSEPDGGAEVYLRAIEMQVAGLANAAVAPASTRSRVSEAARKAFDAVDELASALTPQVVAVRTQGVWQGLYALIGITPFLLVAFSFAEVRKARAMRRLNDDVHALMESTPQVLLSIDAAGQALRWNERLTRAAGLDRQSLRTLRVTSLFPGEHVPAVVDAIDQALFLGSFECEIPLRTAGGPVEYAWVFSRDSNGQEPGLMISGRDVSERREAERRLAATEARYRDLFERMCDGAYITEGTRFLEVNSALSAIFGYSREELLALPTPQLYERPDDRDQFLEEVARDGGVSDYKLRLKRKDGVVLDCLVTASARFDEGGRCTGFQGVVRDVTEKQKLEEALRRSEADYRELFEHAHDAILILDPDTEVVLDANPRAASLYGRPSHEMIGTSMLEFSVDAAHGRECVERTLQENGKYVSLESRQYCSDGSVMDVEIHAAGITYRGQSAILSINRDVTARKREERRVRESEEKFRLLLESVVDYAIYMIDPAGLVVSWNEGAERMFGFEAENVNRRSFSMFYTPEQQTTGAPDRDLREAAATGRVEREEPRVRKNGTSFDASVVLTSIVDEKVSLRGFAQVTRDVTERKKHEAAQREMLEAIQNVATEWTRTFDAVGMPILLLDDEGRIRRLNQAAAALAARGVRDLIDRRVEEIAGEPWQAISALSRFFVNHGVPTEAHAEDRKSGRVWQIASTAVELSGQRRLIVVAQDLTTVTRLEESLRQTELTAALGALVAGVAHEVRNPLFTISATLDTCEARLAASVPELQRYTTPLREEITRLNQLMQELLDYGKPRPLEHADLDLEDVVRAAIAHSRGAAARDVEIALQMECGPAPITGDEGRLQQVLRNVIDNAIQHSPEGQRVIVRVRDGASSDSPALVVDILDGGRGFSDADLRSAFVPFYTRRRGGTGLGLAIAQKFIRAHGGDITLHNRPEQGAIVKIVLPRAAAAVKAAAFTA